MRSASCSLALALAIAAAAYGQSTNTTARPTSNLPSYANARINMTSALGNIFGIRSLLPTFRGNGQVTGGVPNATLNGVPDSLNSANYLKGFGYYRP